MFSDQVWPCSNFSFSFIQHVSLCYRSRRRHILPTFQKKRRFEAYVFSPVSFLPESKIPWLLKASESVVVQAHSNCIDIKNHIDPFLLKKKVRRPQIILLKPCNNSLCQERWVMGSYLWTILGLRRLVLFVPFADLSVNYPVDWLPICRFVLRRAVPLLHPPNFVPRSPTARGKFKKEYVGQSDVQIGQS